MNEFVDNILDEWFLTWLYQDADNQTIILIILLTVNFLDQHSFVCLDDSAPVE